MKIATKIIAILLFLAGLIWLLQGLNILPGSFMSGNPQWSINGSITMVIGGVLYWFANRKRR